MSTFKCITINFVFFIDYLLFLIWNLILLLTFLSELLSCSQWPASLFTPQTLWANLSWTNQLTNLASPSFSSHLSLRLSTSIPSSESQAHCVFQSLSPWKPSPSSTTRAAPAGSSPSKRGRLCFCSSGLPTTGGRGGTTAWTAWCPISTSWSKKREIWHIGFVVVFFFFVLSLRGNGSGSKKKCGKKVLGNPLHVETKTVYQLPVLLESDPFWLNFSRKGCFWIIYFPVTCSYKDILNANID